MKTSNFIIPNENYEISCGDSPGDKVLLCKGHYENANILFPKFLDCLEKIEDKKIVVSICGGSGVGKTGIAGIFAYYLKENGVKSYVISGDNYPQRIPFYNDAERLNDMRRYALKELINAGEYTSERFQLIKEYQEKEDDANPKIAEEHNWYTHYLVGARKGLEDYLGTPKEQCYDEFQRVLDEFKTGKDNILVRKMGRTQSELWYEEVDFSDTEVMIIEWTHGNSEYFTGVDVQILLNSTPEETKEHRRGRNRATDQIDSPFIELVLAIEQGKLTKNAYKSDIIMSKTGEFLSYDEFKKVMNYEQ